MFCCYRNLAEIIDETDNIPPLNSLLDVSDLNATTDRYEIIQAENNIFIEVYNATEDEFKNSSTAGFIETTPLQVSSFSDKPACETVSNIQSTQNITIKVHETDTGENLISSYVPEKILEATINNDDKEKEEEEAHCEILTRTSRKRQRNLNGWKQNVRKHNRQHGKEYINVKGEKIMQKTVKERMCNTNEKCPFKCSIVITKEERKLIHDSFWKLSDEKKVHFYSKHIKRKIAARKRTRSEISKKQYSYEYFFIVHGVQIKVCQAYFLNTLNISKQRIYYFFKMFQNSSTNIPRSPLQGKHVKKCISEEKKNEVRNHIKSFPTVDSHYCRASTNKKYLETNLSLKRMYELYVQMVDEPVKFNCYATIFTNEFNISFYKPKKDICDKCTEYKMNKSPTEAETAKYNNHINRKKLGYLERNNDRNRYLNDNSVAVVTFDLQNTFSLPKSNVSTNFYKTKLSCYNLTAHCNNIVYNAIWHEFQCGRAGIHIACALIKILKQIIRSNPETKKLILWSDSCVPQNKNSIMSFALQSLLNSEEGKNLETIEQKFGEPGHGNVQEIDNAHSCIERYLRNLEIWSPLTLIRLLLSIPKTWKLKFKILQMQRSDYYNYQFLSSQFTYQNIPYTKVKNLIYEKTDLLVIKYRESFDGVVHSVKLAYSKRINANLVVQLPKNIPQLPYKVPIIPAQKKKHLLEMLPQMPNEERDFYYALLNVKNTSKK